MEWLFLVGCSKQFTRFNIYNPLDLFLIVYVIISVFFQNILIPLRSPWLYLKSSEKSRDTYSNLRYKNNLEKCKGFYIISNELGSDVCSKSWIINLYCKMIEIMI